MSTQYKGIDYGNGQSNVDTATGVRYGVISQNSLMPEAFDDVWTQARDLSHETAVSQLKAEIAGIKTESDLAEILKERFHCRCAPELWAEAILIDYTTNDGIITSIDDELLAHVWNEIEDTFNDQYEDGGERDWLYEKEGYKLTNCLQSDVMVLKSPFFTYAQFCSPCVPGACNLDNPLITPPDGVYGGNNFEHDWQKLRDNRAFCLGHDWFDGGRAPYPVYSVETGELVKPVFVGRK